MKHLILVSGILILLGCGNSDDKKEQTVEIDKTKPISPITNNQKNSPPSIPNI